MNTQQKVSRATTFMKPTTKIDRHLSLSNSSLALTAAVTLLVAGVMPAQAQVVGFSNVRINDVALETTKGFNPIPIVGQGSTNGNFTVKVDVYNAPNTPTVPPNQYDFTGNFFRNTNSTVDKPVDFAISYDGRGTVTNPETLSYTFNINQAGVFIGSLTADIPNSNPNYDIPGTPRGTFGADTRGFPLTLVTGAGTAVPFKPSPTLGLLLLGATWGAVSQLKKQKSAINKETKS